MAKNFEAGEKIHVEMIFLRWEDGAAVCRYREIETLIEESDIKKIFKIAGKIELMEPPSHPLIPFADRVSEIHIKYK